MWRVWCRWGVCSNFSWVCPRFGRSKRGKKERKLWREGKNTKFWAHPSGPHPSGLPLFLGLGPHPLGPPPSETSTPPSADTLASKRYWPKQVKRAGLKRFGLNRSADDWPKSKKISMILFCLSRKKGPIGLSRIGLCRARPSEQHHCNCVFMVVYVAVSILSARHLW